MRGQFQHVFTFIMLMIIAGVVLLLGYKFIGSILGSTCEVEQLEFSKTMEKSLKSYVSYGSYHTVALPTPCGAVEICFVAASKYNPNADGTFEGTLGFSYDNSNPVIVDAVSSPSTEPANIFLIDEDGATNPLQYFGDKIALAQANQPLCIKVTSGKFRVGFEGLGRTVKLSDKSLT